MDKKSKYKKLSNDILRGKLLDNIIMMRSQRIVEIYKKKSHEVEE